MSTVTFHVGDVRDRMAAMPDHSIDLIVTSPPFLALRSYLPPDHPDKHREIGSEPTPAAYLDTLLELTAEWRRLLTPTGSLCVELGDTYSGSGGAGGDYLNAGLRDGQPAFDGSASRGRAADREYDGGASDRWDFAKPGTNSRLASGPGWPQSKSLCGIPALYQIALAYGINPLTGQPSPAGQWRCRNQLVWTRPNPPVGALGDKFRPATSYVTVAATSAQRWFDLDAVRTGQYAHPERIGKQINNGRSDTNDIGVIQNAWTNQPEFTVTDKGGAPPLDWHHDDAETERCGVGASAIGDPKETTAKCAPSTTNSTSLTPNETLIGPSTDTSPPESTNPTSTATSAPSTTPPPAYSALTPADADETADWQPLHRLPTAPYPGAHYATYPLALPRKLIEAMCPRQVCVVCGEPRRRIVGEAEYVGSIKDGARADGVIMRGGNPVAGTTTGSNANLTRVAPTLGWTDCRCPCPTCDGEGGFYVHPGDPQDLVWKPCPTCKGTTKWTSANTAPTRPHEPNRSADRNAATNASTSSSAANQTTHPGDAVTPSNYRPGRVLDPFAGSGTTLLAAALSGRDATGIDIDERNKDLTLHRLQAECLVRSGPGGSPNTYVWHVDPALPGIKGEHPDQQSLFG